MSYITGDQLRAARALLRWRAEDLAGHSKVGVATIRRAEAADGTVSMTAANQAALRQTLESAGIVFIPENGGGAGVRLKFNRREVKAIDTSENEGGIVGDDDL